LLCSLCISCLLNKTKADWEYKNCYFTILSEGGEWDQGKYGLFRRSSVLFPIIPAGMYGVECIPDYSNPVLTVETLAST
jgi:hypothetical protein